MDASTSISTGKSSVSETRSSASSAFLVSSVPSITVAMTVSSTGTDLEVTSLSAASSESESEHRSGAELVDMSARPAADAAAAADATASARARVCSAAAASARARARALRRREGGDAIPEPSRLSREAEPPSRAASAPESASACRLGVASPARTPRTMGVTASAAAFVGAGVETPEVPFKPSTTPATILPTASSRCRRRARVSRSTEPRPTHAPARNARMSTTNATGRDRAPRTEASVPASIRLVS
jgi:hypothetical protein